MSETLTPARERKLVRNLANQVDRAIASVMLAVDALPPKYQLLALNEVLTSKLVEHGSLAQRGQQCSDHGERNRAS